MPLLPSGPATKTTYSYASQKSSKPELGGECLYSPGCLERLSGNSERAPFVVPRAHARGRNGTIFGAPCYRGKRDPTRLDTFQTVSRRVLLGNWASGTLHSRKLNGHEKSRGC